MMKADLSVLTADDLLDAAVAEADDCADVAVAKALSMSFPNRYVAGFPGRLIAGDSASKLSPRVRHEKKCTENLTERGDSYRFLYMETTHIIDGVEVHVLPSGAIYWMSDWSRCDELANAGLLHREHRGPGTFGHVTFFLR